jgi:hypothetical protein
MTDEHINIIARKKALQYKYVNEYQYNILVKAIAEGIKFGLENKK